MPSVNPYLTFSSNCEEAFEHYKSVFGGEYTAKIRFSEMPGPHVTAGEENLIMHVALPIGDGTMVMGSDSGSAMGPVTQGNNFSISITAGSEAEADKLFNGLSSGGKVIMPMDKAPWGSYFGMFTDKFGINWMVSYDYPRQ